MQQISLPLGLPLKPKYAKRWQKNTMQLPKISNIIYFFILPVDAVVKPVLAKAGNRRQRTIQSKKRIYK